MGSGGTKRKAKQMTRQDYIFHLDKLRQAVVEIIEHDRKYKELNGNIIAPTSLEEERAKKTQKMFDDLVVRLYEDAAVSEKVKQEKILKGDLEQAEITFPDIPDREEEEPKAEKPAKAAKKKGGAK